MQHLHGEAEACHGFAGFRMINPTYISIAGLTLLLLTILILCSIDFRKKRVIRNPPDVSFLIPCYNDGRTVENTIKSIYNLHQMSDYEIIVVEDKSTDDSLEVLKKLQKKYGFRLVANKRNLGKAASLNHIAKLAKHNLLLFIDADVIMNKKAVYDLFARLEDKGVVATSCPYQPSNGGFLAWMQAIEYNMLSFIQGSYNLTSAPSLWGGCLAVKKEVFFEVGMFSSNMIVEDMDLSLKINGKGHRVMQSFIPIQTQVPTTFKAWYKQKVRWTSGGVQCFIKHMRIWLRNPIHILFLTLFSILSLAYVISVVRTLLFFDNIIDTFHLITLGATRLKNFELTGFYYGGLLFKNLVHNLYFTFFSIPYTIPFLKRFRDVIKVTYVIPFALIYFPLIAIVATIGFFKAVLSYRKLEQGKRAW